MSILASERETETVLTALQDTERPIHILAWRSCRIFQITASELKKINKSNTK